MYASNMTLSGGITYGNANYAPQKITFSALAAPSSDIAVVRTVSGVIGSSSSGTWLSVYPDAKVEGKPIGFVRVSLDIGTSTVTFGTAKLTGSFFCDEVDIEATKTTFAGGSGGGSSPSIGGNISNKPSFDYYG
jgi:hypothetical protein